MSPSHKIYPSGMTEEQRGFTLIELLVVLAIMSLAAILFIGASGSSDGATARGDLAKLESVIASARQEAITTRAPREVILTDYSIKLAPAVGSRSENLIFYADGSSNGGIISRSGKRLFAIRWIDGRIVE
ncbi:pilus assembly FimT family protein [Parasphingorhabdus litoris]|nr:prepilin-type N-terminal cleavage/methylation domain-containing protein [Parasphingorhabdus litoris]